MSKSLALFEVDVLVDQGNTEAVDAAEAVDAHAIFALFDVVLTEQSSSSSSLLQMVFTNGSIINDATTKKDRSFQFQ